jgi:hypothetical protein
VQDVAVPVYEALQIVRGEQDLGGHDVRLSDAPIPLSPRSVVVPYRIRGVL